MKGKLWIGAATVLLFGMLLTGCGEKKAQGTQAESGQAEMETTAVSEETDVQETEALIVETEEEES